MEANTMNEVLKALLDSLKGITDFAVIQSNLYVQELLTYETYNAILSVAISSILFILFLAVIITTIRTYNKDKKINDFIVLKMITSVVLVVFLFICTICNTDRLIKIKTAPRVYLIDYLSKKLK